MTCQNDPTHGGTYEQLINAPEYEAGMNAYCGGMARSFNHYAKDTFRWAAWDLGWIEAEDASE
jgi:hypothetical protein